MRVDVWRELGGGTVGENLFNEILQQKYCRYNC